MQFGGSGLASARHLGQPVVPGSMPSPTQPSRLICLDSLRGLAALVVLLHHAEKLEPWPPLQHLMQLPWLHPKSAVAFFFVLSGFVLQIGLCRRPASLLECAHFWWRRAWRLYPLFWLSLLLAAGLFFTLPVLHSGLSFPEAAGGTVAAADHSDWRQWLLQASLALPGLDGGFINPPIWTLVVEMRVALLFPMVSLTLRALPLWGGMGGAAMIGLGLALAQPNRRVLVLTGEATAQDAAEANPPPHLVVPSLAEFGALLRASRETAPL